MWIGQPAQESLLVSAPRVPGPVDTVGAGDAASAGLACALAGGANVEESAAFANIVASITIQQIGVTGTATPGQVRQQWRAASEASG
jgi:sugar/nucleoside kinase (ribokinase family)